MKKFLLGVVAVLALAGVSEASGRRAVVVRQRAVVVRQPVFRQRAFVVQRRVFAPVVVQKAVVPVFVGGAAIVHPVSSFIAAPVVVGGYGGYSGLGYSGFGGGVSGADLTLERERLRLLEEQNRQLQLRLQLQQQVQPQK